MAMLNIPAYRNKNLYTERKHAKRPCPTHTSISVWLCHNVLVLFSTSLGICRAAEGGENGVAWVLAGRSDPEIGALKTRTKNKSLERNLHLTR